jgi:hypothetical protein
MHYLVRRTTFNRTFFEDYFCVPTQEYEKDYLLVCLDQEDLDLALRSGIEVQLFRDFVKPN